MMIVKKSNRSLAIELLCKGRDLAMQVLKTQSPEQKKAFMSTLCSFLHSFIDRLNAVDLQESQQ